MSWKGIPKTGCAREKSRVEMSDTIGERFDFSPIVLVLLGSQPNRTTGDRRWRKEGRNFSGASTLKAVIK